MSKHPIIFVEWRTRESPRLQEFYGNLFGWKFRETAPGGGYVLADTGNEEVGAGFLASPPDGPGPGILNVIRVKDLAKFEEKVSKLGGRVVVSQREIEGWGRFSIFLDLDGNQIGMVELEKKKKRKKKDE